MPQFNKHLGMADAAAVLGKRGLIVSCQALPGEPLHGSGMMARMAEAAKLGGAIGIRANGASDIREIKQAVNLPVIGLIKRVIPESDIFITPTTEEVRAVLAAGADIVALDVTNRENRYEEAVLLLDHIHKAGRLAMADVSVLEEGLAAARMGFDFIATTLSGYTPYSPQSEAPDFDLIRDLSTGVSQPVVAEGRIWSPDAAVAALEAGAHWVVVGSAITRPQLITERFADSVSGWLAKNEKNGC